MICILICKDRPGQLETRMANRPGHVAYLEALNTQGKLRFAGPFLDDDGKPCGSLVALEVADAAEARALADADPYSRAGLFEDVQIRPWNWVFNKPEGA